jgi:heme exporter protein CcmD
MSGHWPYIVAAYSICFVLFTLDWLLSSLALRKFRREFAMRLRREQLTASKTREQSHE